MAVVSELRSHQRQGGSLGGLDPDQCLTRRSSDLTRHRAPPLVKALSLDHLVEEPLRKGLRRR